jgi:hypothetical protein
VTAAEWVVLLHDEFDIDPESAMRMPFKRFQAWQSLARRRSIVRRNEQLRRESERNR